MLRMLTTRKWIGLTVGMLVLIVAFAALSLWQWQRAQRDRVDRPAVAASDVFVAGAPLAASAYGTRVSVTGTYDAAHQVLVAHGATFYWVVTPLQPATGEAVAVARATVSSAQDPAVSDVTAGVVTVTGVAQPFEGDPGTSATLPAGQTERLTASGLVLPYPAVGGWIALESQSPAAAVSTAAVLPPITGDSTGAIRLQNASYALQWILFAGFVVFFWVRILRDDLREVPDAPTQPAASPVREVY